MFQLRGETSVETRRSRTRSLDYSTCLWRLHVASVFAEPPLWRNPLAYSVEESLWRLELEKRFSTA